VRFRPQGFTLIELLVVIIIIAMLVALLIPGVQAARESARNASSKNNLRQIGLAMANHEAAKGYFPPSWLGTPPDSPTAANINGWAIHALLLPYLEQKVIDSKIDFDVGYQVWIPVTTADGSSTRLSALRIPTYLSPAEPRDEPRLDGGIPTHYPLNYAVNVGTWLVWDPINNVGGNGAAYPNSRLKAAAFTDGLSYTLGFAEVKAWQGYYRNSGFSSAMPPTMPASDADIQALAAGGSVAENVLRFSGHTEWVDGRCHHSGFTTVFRPNQGTLDWNNWQEGKNMGPGGNPMQVFPTWAAITARSYFAGHVNVSMMDGSVRAISDDINLGVWRALSTRAGGELLPDDVFKSN
jgi:prepilin-type N-terminal cleavage/methylation domain-containing protein